MNDLGISLVWLTVQVTTIALAGLALSALVARRSAHRSCRNRRADRARLLPIAFVVGVGRHDVAHGRCLAHGSGDRRR